MASSDSSNRMRHESRPYACVPGSSAMGTIRPKSPHPSASYNPNPKSPRAIYSPTSPFPQTPSPALSSVPSYPSSPFSPRGVRETYLGSSSTRAIGDIAHNSIVDIKDGCFKAPATPSSVGSSPATPATPENSNQYNEYSPPQLGRNANGCSGGKSPRYDFTNSPSQVPVNKPNPILNDLLNKTALPVSSPQLPHQSQGMNQAHQERYNSTPAPINNNNQFQASNPQANHSNLRYTQQPQFPPQYQHQQHQMQQYPSYANQHHMQMNPNYPPQQRNTHTNGMMSPAQLQQMQMQQQQQQQQQPRILHSQMQQQHPGGHSQHNPSSYSYSPPSYYESMGCSPAIPSPLYGIAPSPAPSQNSYSPAPSQQMIQENNMGRFPNQSQLQQQGHSSTQQFVNPSNTFNGGWCQNQNPTIQPNRSSSNNFHHNNEFTVQNNGMMRNLPSQMTMARSSPYANSQFVNPNSHFVRSSPCPSPQFVKPMCPSPQTVINQSPSQSPLTPLMLLSDEDFNFILGDILQNPSYLADKSQFDQYLSNDQRILQNSLNQTRDNNDAFEDIFETLTDVERPIRSNVLINRDSNHIPVMVNSTLPLLPPPMDNLQMPVLERYGPIADQEQSNTGTIRLDDFLILQNIWVEAYNKNSLIKSAEILFKSMFNDEEILNCSLKGKNDTRIFDPKKKLAIARGVNWILLNHGKVDPLSFDSSSLLEITLTNEEKKEIEKKIFTQFKNQLKMKLKKAASKRPCPFPMDIS